MYVGSPVGGCKDRERASLKTGPGWPPVRGNQDIS